MTPELLVSVYLLGVVICGIGWSGHLEEELPMDKLLNACMVLGWPIVALLMVADRAIWVGRAINRLVGRLAGKRDAPQGADTKCESQSDE